MSIYNKNGDLVITGMNIADKYQAEMEATVASVRALMTEPCLVFPLITDIHYLSTEYLEGQTTNSRYLFFDSVQNIKHFAHRVRCDFLVNLGDNTDGNVASSTTMERNEKMLEAFLDTGLLLCPCIGNHDDNRYSSGSDKLGLSSLFRGYIANTAGVTFDSSMNGTNYYLDCERFKIRCIFLNCQNAGAYGFSANTAAWFANTAMDIPEGYSVLIFGHLSPIASINGGNSLSNSAAILDAISAHSEDVIAYICGHLHGDGSWVLNGFRNILINCNKFLWGTRKATYPEGITFPDRTLGEASEDCWDVVVVRPGSRKINFVRFGAGDDREFSY